MSYKVFFSFSTGLSKPFRVRKGTYQRILDHVREVEQTLGYETEQYMKNPPHWKTTEPKDGVTDEVFCQMAERHNRYVQRLYDIFADKTKIPVKDRETITPRMAKKFWRGLNLITVPPSRWTRDYYKARMEELYAVMRGRETAGISFDEKPLTIRQAAQVINIFSPYLDKHDIQLDVPQGHDDLYASDDYLWCEKCGAVTWEHAEECRKRGCPVRKEYEMDKEEKSK